MSPEERVALEYETLGIQPFLEQFMRDLMRPDLSRLWDAVALWTALWHIDEEYTGPPLSYWPYRD